MSRHKASFGPWEHMPVKTPKHDAAIFALTIGKWALVALMVAAALIVVDTAVAHHGALTCGAC